MSDLRILPADVYDALELSALVYGGIGAGRFREANGVPYCVLGHASDLDVDVHGALRDSGIGVATNDDAVYAINVRRGTGYQDARVSFEDWRTEIGVTRGEK